MFVRYQLVSLLIAVRYRPWLYPVGFSNSFRHCMVRVLSLLSRRLKTVSHWRYVQHVADLVFEDNRDLSDILTKKAMPRKEYFTVPTDDGDGL